MGDVLSFMQYLDEDQKRQFVKELTGKQGFNFGDMFGNASDKIGNAAKFTQNNIQPIAQGVGGLLELGTNLFGGSGINRDESGNSMATDIYGRPIYSYQNYQESIDTLKDNRKGQIGESVVSGLGSGAKAGMAIGSMIPVPGASIIGAGAGALVGSVAGLIGGKKRDKEMKSEIANREGMLKDSTVMFNQNNSNYFTGNQADSVQSYLLSQRARRV